MSSFQGVPDAKLRPAPTVIRVLIYWYTNYQTIRGRLHESSENAGGCSTRLSLGSQVMNWIRVVPPYWAPSLEHLLIAGAPGAEDPRSWGRIDLTIKSILSTALSRRVRIRRSAGVALSVWKTITLLQAGPERASYVYVLSPLSYQVVPLCSCISVSHESS